MSATYAHKLSYCLDFLNGYYDRLASSDSWLPTTKTSYPVYDTLSNDEKTVEEKITAILDYLSNNFQPVRDENQRFWYNVSDEINNNPEWITNRNGRRILHAMYRAARMTEAFPNECIMIYQSWYNRRQMRINDTENVHEVESIKIFNDCMSLINSVIALLPKRKVYRRWNAKGDLIETFNPEWCLWHCDSTHSPKSKWLEADAQEMHYGVELEVDMVNRETFTLFCEYALEQGWLDDGKLIAKSDTSLDASSTYGVEWVSVPLCLSKAQAFWKDILAKFTELKVKTGFEQTNGGLHIHIDKHRLTESEQLEFTDTMYALSDDKKKSIFERSPNDYCDWDRNNSCAYNQTYKPMGRPDQHGVVSCQVIVEIIANRYRYTLVNFQNRNSIEIRGFNSSCDVPTKLQWLADFIYTSTGKLVSPKQVESSIFDEEVGE